MTLPRRRLLAGLGLGAGAALAGCGAAEVERFPTLAAARSAVEGLRSGWRSSGAWPLAQVVEHLAQSIEYSLHGYPQPRHALFQSTVGSAAWSFFDSRGRMSHSLADPIPGAPALAAMDTGAAVDRLLAALRDFEARSGALKPHFAYGALDKASYTRAHLMHLASHWTEFVRA